MDNKISKLNFIQNKAISQQQAKASEKAAKEALEDQQAEYKQLSAQQILDAMQISAVSKKAALNIGETPEAAAVRYLGAERVKSIQDSMVAFGAGVETHRAQIEAEFGTGLSEAVKLSMAARAFSLE